ncbi:MAG: hypothetical protein KGL52_08455 [Rhodospirillales bacterium]|jgi:hypothetical protein|nr:hypothetical protein [Rhodospirillales bacterium]
MNQPIAAPRLPRGFSFPIAELQTIQRWASRYGMLLTIELDRCIDGEDYEEVVTLRDRGLSRRHWTLWRSAEHVVVEPQTGAVARFARLSAALAALRA